MSIESSTEQKIPGTKAFRNNHMTANRFGALTLFSGSASPQLADEIAAYIRQHSAYHDVHCGRYQRVTFSNENIFIRLEESVRGKDVYIVQTMSSPVHENIFELLIMIDALKRDSAWRINVVVPYLAYGRSDKKDQPRVPITARLLANMLEVAGADRYMTIDLHAGQIQGFFNIPGDALTAFHLLSDYVAELHIENLTVAATDLGFAKTARNWAHKLNCPVAFVEKRRDDNAERPRALSVVGDVRGRNVLLVDDEVNTAGSVVNAVTLLREFGAQDIYLAFTHPFLTDEAYQRLDALGFREIICTNTIPLPAEKVLPNMTVLSVAPMLAEVILRAHEGRSVGELFDE